MELFRLNLQMFTEGGGEAAPAAPEAAAPEAAGAETAAAEAGQPAQIRPGDTLPNGQKASAQVAAAMTRQMKKHPELQKVYGQNQQQEQQAAPAEKTIEQRWDEIKKGEFKELYGKDVQDAVKSRFKNQQDTSGELSKLEPMLKVLRERAGVGSNDELISHVMDDPSLYEEAASEAGMTVDAYRKFMDIKAERDRMAEEQQQSIHDQQMRKHFNGMQQQAERMKQNFPDFDLQKELANPAFLRMTSPEVGLSVEDAYFAVHHKELAPQMMAYGMQRARTQMGQTLQAQRTRPAEGAMKTNGQPAAEVRLDPRSLTARERAELRRQIHMGKKVSFD